MKGKFITVEGVEGVGKSTNIDFIAEQLQQAGKDVLLTREPGGTPLAEEIRAMLLARRNETVDVTCELLLVFAARAQHLNSVIVPALNEGKWVVCDRFTDATFAYQGGGRGLPQSTIVVLEQLVQKELRPDVTFLLDLDVNIGLERARARAELDRFESEKKIFFDKVRNAYLRRVESNPGRYRIISAEPPLDIVQKDIARHLDLILAAC